MHQIAKKVKMGPELPNASLKIGNKIDTKAATDQLTKVAIDIN